jgi:hypothetical protein
MNKMCAVNAGSPARVLWAWRKTHLIMSLLGLAVTLGLHADTISWVGTKTEAFTQAKAQGKLVLMVAGLPDCTSCNAMKSQVCELTNPPIRQIITDTYVPWFCNINTNQDFLPYCTDYESGFSLPLTCWIDPLSTELYVLRKTDAISPGVFIHDLANTAMAAGPRPTNLFAHETLVDGSFIVQGRIWTELGISQVFYRVDAGVWHQAESTSSGWAAPLASVGLAEGPHVFEVYGSLNTSELSATNQTEFTLDPSGPSTRTISGTIKQADGTGLAAVIITAGSVTSQTDSTGHFALALPQGWTGILIPAKTGYEFQPNHQDVTASNNATSFNFTAAIAVISPVRPAGFCLQLQPGIALKANNTTLDVGDFAVPCVADWNGDGKKDLLVGYQTDAKIRLYLNQNTDAEPVFSSFTLLKAGGVEIQHPSPGCGSPTCWVCDWDHDKLTDLLVGTGADGRIIFYRNTNDNHNPMLAAGQTVMANGSPINVSSRATPFVYDWNQDGKEDLLCGSGDGWVYLFLNTQSTALPAYDAAVKIKAGNVDLNLGTRSVVRVWDWDGDGVNDLIGSSSTGVYWCRNRNNNAQPILDAARPIQSPLEGLGLANINTGTRMRLDLVDWNNDGIMDLLLGNTSGTINFYQGYYLRMRSPLGLPDGQIELSWDSAPCLKYQLLSGTNLDSITNLVLSEPQPSEGTHTTNKQCSTCSPTTFYRIQVVP